MSAYEAAQAQMSLRIRGKSSAPYTANCPHTHGRNVDEGIFLNLE